MWWHLGCIGEERGVQDYLGDLSEGGHLEELGIEKIKLFKMTFKE